MKKRIITLAVALLCTLSLASCGQDIAKEATEKGRNYFDSGDYETAAKAFGVAIDNGSTEEEVSLLYDITLTYCQASKAYKEKRYETASEIISSVDSKYSRYGIKDSVDTLKSDIQKALETEALLKNIPVKIAAGDYIAAIADTEAIDKAFLSDAQIDMVNDYKTQIAEAQAEAARIEAERIAEEERKAAEKAAAEKRAAEKKAAEKKAAEKKAAEKKAQAAIVTQPAAVTTPPQTPVTPAINTNVAADAFIFPSDTVLLTREQLSTLSKADISLIKNEIYARKGHVFTTTKYISYFSGKSWYTPTKTIYWGEFTETEKANLRLLKEFENR